MNGRLISLSNGNFIYINTMAYIYDTLNVERLRHLLQVRGMNERDFFKKLWGAQTHRDFNNYFGTKTDVDVKCSTLVKICSILNISMDTLFTDLGVNDKIPSVMGNDNIINSSIVGADISRLKHENDALKLIISEKDARIEDLKNINAKLEERLDLLLKIGQFSDK